MTGVTAQERHTTQTPAQGIASSWLWGLGVLICPLISQPLPRGTSPGPYLAAAGWTQGSRSQQAAICFFAFYPMGLEGRKSRGFTAAVQRTGAHYLLSGSHFSPEQGPHSPTTELGPVFAMPLPLRCLLGPTPPSCFFPLGHLLQGGNSTAEGRRQIAHGP